MSVVDVRGLVIEFDTPKGRKRVVNGVSFDVSPGEVLGILGESGSGKTMSTQAILGLIDGYPGVMGGEITFTPSPVTPSQGEPVSLLADLESTLVTRRGERHKKERVWQQRVRRVMSPLWGSQITAIFQNPRRSLDPLMTVGQQLTESLRYADGGQDQTREALRAEALTWLERVQMVNPERVFESYPHELSGGMCQRAMIAVALACQPALLVADEPTTGLDATVRAQIITLLQELVREAQCAMLYISHDIREVLYLTDRVIVMRHGDVVERVSTADLKADQGERHPYTRSLLDASGLVGQRAPAELERVQESTPESTPESARDTPVILEAKGLKKSFIGRDKSVTRAIDDVDLTLSQGEVVALIGESGSGKTTLGRALSRLLQLDEGSVTLNGQPLTSLKGRALREARRGFQVVFQNQQANLHPNMSVREMLDESLRLHRAQLSSEERAAHITELLGRVGLHEHEGRYVASLSGGEQRRVGLARILATTPQLIVADEPTSGLDAAIKLQTIALLKELKGSELTYLLISHDLGLVRRIADRVLVMLRGRIIERFSIGELGLIEHHPYTQKLLAAAQLGDRPLEHDTASIEDLAPSEEGCAYASLCPLASAKGLTERCRGERPPLTFTSPQRQSIGAHAVACFALTEGATEDSKHKEEQSL